VALQGHFEILSTLKPQPLFCGRVALSSATPTNALSEERDKRERERERETDKRLRDISHPHASQWNS